MGAQWKARHKEIAANAKGKIFGKLSKKSWLPQKAEPTRIEFASAPGSRAGKKVSMPKKRWNAPSKKARVA